MANKTKRAMSSEAKAKARTRKAGITEARKLGRRNAQERAASLNRATGRKPWDLVKLARLKARALERAKRHGVSGAA